MPDNEPAPLTDEESRAAMRAFLQRSEVRLSTLHRVGQALLGGSALVLLLPLFLRDCIPRMMTVLMAAYDANQSWVPIVSIGVAAALVLLIPVPAIFLLVGDLLGFYFTSNTFGAHRSRRGEADRVRFNPRFIVPGLGFNHDELSVTTKRLLEEGRDEEWTRALLIPPVTAQGDGGWRDRFDTRTAQMWGRAAAAGPAGDAERMRQTFRLAGLHHDRTLAHDVARTEALLARHVLMIRTVVLRYSKALLLLISTTVASLAAAGFVEQAIREDPAGGKFTGGFPYRTMFLVALVYVLWAPLAELPLRMIRRHTPGVGEYSDVYLDRKTTQFESAMVLVSFVVLVAASTAMVYAGHAAAQGSGLALGVVLSAVALLAWLAALRGYRATLRDTLTAAVLLLRGREAPAPQRRPGALPHRGVTRAVGCAVTGCRHRGRAWC